MNAPTLFYDIDRSGDICWFVHAFYPALISYNLVTNQASLEIILPYFGNGQATYGPIKKCGNKVYIAPRCSDRLLIFDIEDKKISEVSINIEPIKEKGIFNMFTSIYAYEDNIFLFPGRYPAIVKYNISKNTVEYIDEWFEKDKNLIDDDNLVIFGNACPQGHIIYLPCWQKSKYYVFSLIDNSMILNDVGIQSGLSSISYMGDKIFCSSKCNGSIHIINGNERIDFDGSNNKGISKLICWGKDVFVIPIKGQSILKYNYINHTWEKLKTIKCQFENIPKKYQLFDFNFLSVKVIESCVFMASNYDGKIKILDMNNNIISECRIELSKEDKRRILDTSYLDIVYEDNRNILDDYLINILEI